MVLGLTQPLVKMSTRDIPGCKGGWCVRLTTSPPSCAECYRNVGVSTFWNPLGHTGPVTGFLYLYLLYFVISNMLTWTVLLTFIIQPFQFDLLTHSWVTCLFEYPIWQLVMETTKASFTEAGLWVDIWTWDLPNSNLYFLIYNTLLWGCVCVAACVSVGAWVTSMCHFNSLWALPQLVCRVFLTCWVYIITLERHLCLISQSGLFGCCLKWFIWLLFKSVDSLSYLK